jgi:hypothetical protein
MMQIGAEVAFGFIIYHPIMMVATEGQIPGTGVYFEKTETEILFKYPEGVAGVTSYPLVSWSAWLASHYFSVGPPVKKCSYKLELLGNRDCFLFYRMTKVEGVPQETAITHAMELRNSQDSYVVYSWRLKNLTADPTDAGAWEPENFVADRRVVDRTYQFAMQLPNDNFTQYAVRKQLKITNDRCVVEGTSVTVSAPLTPQQIDSLGIAIFSRCFVDRYDKGLLSSLMMQELRKLVDFTSTSALVRVSAVAVYCLWCAWDWTLGPVNSAVRGVVDALRRLLGRVRSDKNVEFLIAPRYAAFSTVTGDWKKTLHGLADDVVASHVVQASEKIKLLGGGLALVSQQVSRRMASLRDADLAVMSTILPRFPGKNGIPVMKVFTDDLDHSLQVALGDMPEDEVRRSVRETIRSLNEFDEEPVARHVLPEQVVVPMESDDSKMRPDYQHDPDPINTLNEVYRVAMPGMQRQQLEYDTASISLDPQDRTLAAPYLRMPLYFGSMPVSRRYFRSKVCALNVPKRQGTHQELLSAIAARNLSAPQIAKPQDDSNIIPEIWRVFLEKACVPDAKAKIAEFQKDPVALGEEAYRQWQAKATPQSIAAVKRELEEHSQSMQEMPVNEYIAMLKSDVKPTLSTKPLTFRTEPQVIVYHEKQISSLYSSLFRVLVRRFLALLKPNYFVNLLKDTEKVREFVNGIHPFGHPMKYLENDFSKYDKSQSAFAFALEEYIFRQLGMNEEMLAKWMKGHVECKIRSVTTGLSLHVMYQRKSGDATTAFGNVILNAVSVTYAYRSTQVVWAVFMGDDSLICANVIGVNDQPVQSLAEIFNLSAKSYITDSPYWASNFFEIDDFNERAVLLPDPVKRIEKLSMHVEASEPQWQDRYRSFKETIEPYRYQLNTAMLARHVAERYPTIPREEAARLPSALATIGESFHNFRNVWSRDDETSLY